MNHVQFPVSTHRRSRSVIKYISGPHPGSNVCQVTLKSFPQVKNSFSRISPQTSPSGNAGCLTLSHNNKKTCCFFRDTDPSWEDDSESFEAFYTLWGWPGPVWCWSRFIEFPLASGSHSQTSYFTKPLVLNAWAGKVCTFNFYFCMLLTNWVSTEKSDHISVLLCPRAKTVSVYLLTGCQSVNLLSHLVLCNQAKIHLFRNYQASHALLSESHPLSHHFPLHVTQMSCKKGYYDFDPAYCHFWFVMFLKWRLLHFLEVKTFR